ncbi:MAG: PEGA domain-containing protein, partial [Pseudomonadota bacterium]
PAPAPAAVPTGKGFMVVESDRYAMIYMGGRRLGGTPVARIELEPGTYAIRAVCRDTGASQTKQIEVKPGELSTATFKFLP